MALWCAPPSRDSETPDGVPAIDEARAGVRAVDERVEPAADERVVDRADRQQLHVLQLVGQPELAQQQEQVHLGDAELEVLAARGRLPAQRRALLLLVDRLVGRREHPAAVDPAAEARRDRDVGARGDDVARDRLDLGQVLQRARERLLRRGRARGRVAELRRHVGRRRSSRAAAPRPPSSRSRARRHRSASADSGSNAGPLVVGVGQRLAQPVDLLRAEHRRVVQRVAGDRQAPALDGEGEDDARPLASRRRTPRGRRSRRRRRAPRGRRSAPPSSSSGYASSTRASFGRWACRAPASRPSRISLPGRRSMLWYSPFGISSMRRRSVSPPSQGERGPQARAVLERDDVPAVVGEHRRELGRADARHDAIEALAVEVDDPGDAAEPARGHVGDGLPHVALVELRVADQRHEAAAVAEAEVRLAGSGRRRRRTGARRRRGRRSRWRSRPGRGPSSATGTTAGRRSRAASSGTRGRGAPAGS